MPTYDKKRINAAILRGQKRLNAIAEAIPQAEKDEVSGSIKPVTDGAELLWKIEQRLEAAKPVEPVTKA